MPFFSKPTKLKPQTRPQSAPAKARQRKTITLQQLWPAKGNKVAPKPRSGL